MRGAQALVSFALFFLSMSKPFRHVHFIGICGTAMGAVAAAMRAQGYTVTGLGRERVSADVHVSRKQGHQAERRLSRGEHPGGADLIVVGNAISRGNPEIEAVLNRKLYYLSLPETLKQFFLRGRHNLVVTGTHGKTTTTALLTWILQKRRARSGLHDRRHRQKSRPGRAACTTRSIVVIEGDEYDTAFFDKRSKFLHYLPELVIVNNIEFDHADIFDDLDEIKLSFRRLLNIVPSERHGA